LDRYSSEQANGHRFYLSIATSAGLDKYVSLNLSALNQYLDAIHLMAYDFMGSWSNTGHHANLYRSSSNPASTVGAIHETIDDYMRRGVPADKVVLGLPLYGRAFANTDGAGASHGGEGPVDYKLLPRPSALEAVDQEAVAAYSYDPATREWVSYDNVETVAKKADYICNRGLGGAMWWEASGDRQGGGSFIDNMSNGLGYSFQWSENILSFPTSRYNNIRSGMWKMDEELAEEQNITAVAKQGVEGGEKQQVQEGEKQEAEDLWGAPPPLAYSHCIPIVWICW
jgi:chitinase